MGAIGEKAAFTQDLTQGKVTKVLFSYAMPIVSGNLLQALYGMADMVIAGHFIGNTGLSAINNASQVMLLATNIAIGLSIGGSVVVGQHYGAKDEENYKEAAGTLFTVMFGLGCVMSLLLFACALPVLTLLKAPSMDNALHYMRVCAFGMIPVFGYNALSAVLRAVGNSRRPLHIIAVAAGMNIVLDLLFVGVFSQGVGGAAYATILSQTSSFLLVFLLLRKNRDVMEFTRKYLRVCRTHLRVILQVGIPSIIQMTLASLSWITVTFFINGYGVIVSAASGVSIKIKDFCQLLISAMANAVTSIVAQNLGAGMYDRAKSMVLSTLKITLSIAAVSILLVELFAPRLAGIFTSDEAVIRAAALNLRIEIIGQVFYAAFLVFHALAIGAGHTSFAMCNAFLNGFLCRIPLVWVLSHFFALPGLYVACMAAPVFSVLFGWLYLHSNVWRRSIANKNARRTQSDHSKTSTGV